MSVDAWRDAAAQRTAASRSWRRLASWLVVLPVLAYFSFAVVAGAAVGPKPDYAGAAKALPKDKQLVVVAAPKQEDTLLDRLTRAYAQHEVCAVSASQLARIASVYSVGHMTVSVDGANVDIVTVSGAGANDHDLRALLGDPNLKCKLVREAGMFFLPFDARTS